MLDLTGYDYQSNDFSTPKNIEYWVLKNIEYKPDPKKSPQETLDCGYGDCEDMVMLMQAIYYNVHGKKSDINIYLIKQNNRYLRHAAWKVGNKVLANTGKIIRFEKTVYFDYTAFESFK